MKPSRILGTKHSFWIVFSMISFFFVAYATAQDKVVVIPLMQDATGPPAPLPKTGQTDCYYGDGTSDSCTCGTVNCPSGQDGDLEKGEAWPNPRFVDHGNGAVIDKLTGLIWLKEGECSFHPTNPTIPNERSWTSALAACNQLASGTGRCDLTDGSSAGDWRLPNLRELDSLPPHYRQTALWPHQRCRQATGRRRHLR